MKTDVVVCREHDPASKCARLMLEHNVGFLPVIDLEDRLVGVVTDRDLVTRILADPLRGPDTQVNRVMSRALLTCGSRCDLLEIESMMGESKKSRIIVVDDAGSCVGVISLSDIGQVDRPERTGVLLRAITRREAFGPVL